MQGASPRQSRPGARGAYDCEICLAGPSRAKFSAKAESEETGVFRLSRRLTPPANPFFYADAVRAFVMPTGGYVGEIPVLFEIRSFASVLILMTLRTEAG